MSGATMGQWLGIGGAGSIWLGVQIVWVVGLPRALRRGDVPHAEPGSPQAFTLAWLDQYAYIGLALTGVGIALAAWGLSR